jgi:hypothetical protein
MKRVEGALTHKVGVPHPNNVLDAQLAHEQAVHPSERKLNELDTLFLEMSGKRRCVSVDSRPGISLRIPVTKEEGARQNHCEQSDAPSTRPQSVSIFLTSR